MTRCSFNIDTSATPALLQILLEDEQGAVAHHQVPLTEDDIKRLWFAVTERLPEKWRIMTLVERP